MAIEFNNVGSNSIRDQARAEAASHKDKPAPDRAATADAAQRKPHAEVSLSPGAKKLKALADEMSEQPAVDAERVAQIQRAITEGRYHVDPVLLAQKFIEIEGEL